MNSCIMMAQVFREPELRSTPDGMAVADMLVEFEGLGPEDPMTTIKVVGWGKLAEEIKQKYTNGDRIIIEGRLSMNTIDLPEGYKEKRAELVASRIYPVDGASSNPSSTSRADDNSIYSNNYSQEREYQSPVKTTPIESPVANYASNTVTQTTPPSVATPENSADEDWDEIPFVRPIYSRTNFGSQLCDSWELEANQYWDGVKQFV